MKFTFQSRSSLLRRWLLQLHFLCIICSHVTPGQYKCKHSDTHQVARFQRPLLVIFHCCMSGMHHRENIRPKKSYFRDTQVLDCDPERGVELQCPLKLSCCDDRIQSAHAINVLNYRWRDWPIATFDPLRRIASRYWYFIKLQFVDVPICKWMEKLTWKILWAVQQRWFDLAWRVAFCLLLAEVFFG